MNLILFLLAYILGTILLPIGFIFGAITRKNKYKNIAISIDQLGNVILAPLMDVVLITKKGLKFGNVDMTISMVLGVNKKTKTLTFAGHLIAWILNKIEKNHVEKAIEADAHELEQDENR